MSSGKPHHCFADLDGVTGAETSLLLRTYKRAGVGTANRR